ncbi:flagellar hook-associated protein FlgK [Pseudooceanicola sp.]|uniref:flagellar hook-associated protein FlgK n=1 Tax=Pseudooceanicola sp. TaxID=1914328 RepID=UPI0035C66190
MSILSSILASRSGLMANSLRAEIVSNNIANAQDENYSRRSVQVASGLGGGVQVTGIARAMDSSLDALFRTELSFAATQNAMADVLGIYTAQLGALDSETSIPSLLSALQNDIGLMSNDPGDTSLQQEVLLSAKALAHSLREANSALFQVSKSAYNGINSDIQTANAAMTEIARINSDIVRAVPGSPTYATLQDRRAEQLDTLASVMQIQVSYDSENRIAVHAAGGHTLVKAGYVNELSFDRGTGVLTAGGEDITPGSSGRRGANEGSLAGYIKIATEIVPQSQLELDEVARSLIEGFEDADASLAPGQAGLFTDAGSALGATFGVGLAGRITVNTAADPYQGGDLTLLRDGLGAVTPGAASDNSQILSWLAFFDSEVSYDPAAGQGSSAKIIDFTNGIFSAQQARRVAAETSLNSLTASSEIYRANRLNARGVNIDTELQDLQLIEQAYNANSQALRVASEMIDTLLNIT